MPFASIGTGDLAKVWEFKTLGRVRDAEARSLLEKIAKQVQPVMRKRNCPRNSALLGLNIGSGQEVRIRLRKQGRECEFLPYESLVGTMLHELTHNVHGAHDANFYKLLDEITKECEDFMVKGISGTGQGFDAPGQRLGGYIHYPNMRQAALAAAEKRARIGSLMPSGPRRLGGDSEIMQSLSPIQAAAMAAERRLRDDLWCAAPDTLGEDGLQRARDREDANEPVLPMSEARRTIGEPGSMPNPSEVVQDLRESVVPKWKCASCTLLNPPLASICAACSTVRLDSTQKSKTWSCKFCTLENTVSLDKCAACDQWRYSYGEPLATFTPYVGS